MSVLFQNFKLGSMEIENRFVRPATTSAWADSEGVIRPEVVELYERLAEGGVPVCRQIWKSS